MGWHLERKIATHRCIRLAMRIEKVKRIVEVKGHCGADKVTTDLKLMCVFKFIA